MSRSPTIGQHMTPAKYWVTPDDPISRAKEQMQAGGVRHLPVLEGDRVVGMLTLGDLWVMEAVAEVDPDETEVSSAMSREVYAVSRETPLADVAKEMWRRHIGSTLVLEDGKLVGLFTTTDACRVLGELLEG